MKIGIIYCAYASKDLVAKSLEPWLEFRRNYLDGQSVHICGLSVKFYAFDGDEDGTKDLLRSYRGNNSGLEHLIDGPDNIPETTARGMAFDYLKQKGADIIWQVDSDEFYTQEEIKNIVKFVNDNPWIGWFKLSFKNLVFDSNTYLTEPFTPPRIHRVNFTSYKAAGFSDDNDIFYTGILRNEIVRQDFLPSMLIPKEVCWIKHESWPNNERGRKKVIYQKRRWGNACRFDWDDNQGGLIFSPNHPKPQTNHV